MGILYIIYIMYIINQGSPLIRRNIYTPQRELTATIFMGLSQKSTPKSNKQTTVIYIYIPKDSLSLYSHHHRIYIAKHRQKVKPPIAK